MSREQELIAALERVMVHAQALRLAIRDFGPTLAALREALADAEPFLASLSDEERTGVRARLDKLTKVADAIESALKADGLS